MQNYLDTTINLYKILQKNNISRVKENFIFFPKSIIYNHPLGKILTISHIKIIFNNYDLNKDLKNFRIDNITNKSNLKKFDKFIKDNKNKILRLGHIGFSYICSNLPAEVNKYKNIFKNSPFKIYEDKSTEPKSRWLFIGHKKYKDSPLIELILQQGKMDWDYIWTPHIQIHLDTTFTEQELNRTIKKYFKIKPSYTWELRYPRGLIVKAFSLAKVNGVNFNLGIGTYLAKGQVSKEIKNE